MALPAGLQSHPCLGCRGEEMAKEGHACCLTAQMALGQSVVIYVACSPHFPSSMVLSTTPPTAARDSPAWSPGQVLPLLLCVCVGG